MNDLMLMDSITIGIKLWFAPQISEHCPYANPDRLIKVEVWFNRPGTASTLTPNDGIVQEWITSWDVINRRTWVLNGKITRLSTSSKRNSLISNSLEGFIYESNSILKKSEYSYDQYHWCPIIFNVNIGLLTSSNMYNNRNDGKAIKIKIIAGNKVQTNSINWPSSKNRLIRPLRNNITII